MKTNDEISPEAERARNRVAAAEALYGEVLEQFPDHVYALRGLADTYVLKGLVEAVERQGINTEEWSTIEAANKAHAGNFIEAAKSYLADGFSGKAQQMLDCALEFDPGNSDLLWQRGEMYRALGHFTEALDAYNRILAIDPENEAAVFAKNMIAGKSASLDSAGALWARAEAYRAEGNLDAAIETYRQLLGENPENAAAGYVCAVLAGAAPVAALPDYMPRPAPFAMIKNFLSAEEHDELLQITEGLRENFGPSTVGFGETQSQNPDIRKSRLVSKIENEKYTNWFEQRITGALAEIRSGLYMDAFDIGVIELQITTHHDGEYYGEHDDVGEKGSGAERRKVSFSYYYHWQPKAFEGGDLLLHDSNRHTEREVTRIAPVDNCIVFFPSEYLHEVTPVHLVSPP